MASPQSTPGKGSRQTRPARLPSASPIPISRIRGQSTTPGSLFGSSLPQSQGARDYFTPREEPAWTVFGQLLEDDRTPGSRGYDTPVHSIRRGRSRAVSRQLLPAVSASPEAGPALGSPIPAPQFITSPPRQTVSPPRQPQDAFAEGTERPLSAADSHFSAFTRTESFGEAGGASGE